MLRSVLLLLLFFIWKWRMASLNHWAKNRTQPFQEVFFGLQLPKTAVCGWLRLICRKSPFPVEDVISAVWQAVNSPLTGSYGSWEPLCRTKKENGLASSGVQVWFLNICKTHIYIWETTLICPLVLDLSFQRSPPSGQIASLWERQGQDATFNCDGFGCVLPCHDRLLHLVYPSSNFSDIRNPQQGFDSMDNLSKPVPNNQLC